MYACPTCGAGLVFDPKTQKLLCPSCRNQYEPKNIEKMRLDQAKEIDNESDLKDEYEAISYKCSHCGAELITTDETITTFCSFCRTGTMLDRKIIKKKRPDFIIPFKITKEECEEIYINKIKKSIFAPKDMIEEQEVKKIRGIYMPYWIYSFEKHSDDVSEGSKYSHRSGDYQYYDDYSLTTNVDAKCYGITHDATSNFYDRLSEAIAPYSIKENKNFSPAYFSGYYADNEDVNESIYFSENEKIASEHLSRKLGKEKEYRKYKAKPKIDFDNKSAKLALFPVYFLATKNKRNDRISYAVINGQTGKIAADIPIDFKKFIIFAMILSIVIFVLLNLFLSISMPKLIISSVIFNVISLIILINQNKKIDKIENQTEDKGVQAKISKESTNTSEKKNSLMNKILIILFICIIVFVLFIFLKDYYLFRDLYKYVIGGLMLIGFLYTVIKSAKNQKSYNKPIYGLMVTMSVFLLNPASDIYYYIAAFISIGFTIWSFYNIIEKINILTTRKLPQLGKRGGDENA